MDLLDYFILQHLLHYRNKTPLPLTDPRDTVPQARVVHRCKRSVKLTPFTTQI